jgi:hypothetical protein
MGNGDLLCTAQYTDVHDRLVAYNFIGITLHVAEAGHPSPPRLCTITSYYTTAMSREITLASYHLYHYSLSGLLVLFLDVLNPHPQ